MSLLEKQMKMNELIDSLRNEDRDLDDYQLNLPYELEDDFLEALKCRFERVKEKLGNSINQETHLIDFFQSSYNAILMCYNQMISSQEDRAFNNMSNFLNDIMEDLKKISELDYNKYKERRKYCYRAARGKHEDKKYLFHVPFQLREKAAKTRYSFDGVPVLYLGETVFTCWEELRRPNDENISFSRFEVPDSYRFITIAYLPAELVEDMTHHSCKLGIDEKYKYLYSYIRILPLIMACSVRENENRKKIKLNSGLEISHEYIIPQLVTKWLVNNINANRNDFDGMSFFSTRTMTHSKKNPFMYRNLAIPVKTKGSRGYCEKLKSEILLTDPEMYSKDKFLIDNIKMFEYSREGMDISSPIEIGSICIERNSEIKHCRTIFQKIEDDLGSKKADIIK